MQDLEKRNSVDQHPHPASAAIAVNRESFSRHGSVLGSYRSRNGGGVDRGDVGRGTSPGVAPVPGAGRVRKWTAALEAERRLQFDVPRWK